MLGVNIKIGTKKTNHLNNLNQDNQNLAESILMLINILISIKTMAQINVVQLNKRVANSLWAKQDYITKGNSTTFYLKLNS